MNERTWGWRLDVQISPPTGPFRVVGYTDDEPSMREWFDAVRERNPDEVYRAHELRTGEVLS